MFSSVWNTCKSFFNRVKETIKKFTTPTMISLAANAVSDMTRNRKDLVTENAMLRQQLIVLNRQVKRPKYLIRDNDSKFGKRFSSVAENSGIEELKTPFQAPKANALCERLIGTMKRECLDYFFILNQYQLKRIVTQFADYYNQHRAHQGIDQRVSAQFSQPRPTLSNRVKGKVTATPFLNGLHHSYAYAVH
jgi:putative transposase